MAESTLITFADVLVYRKVDPKYNDDKFTTFADSIQQKNLRYLLGDALYYDFFEKYPDGGVYDDLVDGKVYEYNSNDIQYYGLKPVLVYWWLAMATREGDLYLSNYGAIQFTNNTQQQFETGKEKERIATGYMETAQEYANEVIKFLNANSGDYDLWESNDEKNSSEFLTFRL